MLSKNEKRILAALAFVLLLAGANLVLVLHGWKIVIRPPRNFSVMTDIKIFGECSTSYQEQLQLVPEPILQSFIANKWILCIGCGFSEGSLDGQAYSGATDYQNKTIHLEEPISLLHEFGHYYQYIQPMNNWSSLFEQEAAAAVSVLGSYAVTNTHEYFAETFEYYMCNQNSPENMTVFHAVAPATVAKLESLARAEWNLTTMFISLQPIPSPGKD